MNMIRCISNPVTFAATVFIGLAGVTAAFAGSLYDAPPSATSAFVRFIEAEGKGAEKTGLEWREQAVPFGDFTEGQYIAVESDTIGSTPGQHITVAFQPSGETLEFAEIERKKGKVALQMLNLSSLTIDLKTADGKIAILENVANGELAARQINPIAVAVMVEADGASLGTVDLALKRSDNPMIIIRPDGSVEMIKSALKGSNNQ